MSIPVSIDPLGTLGAELPYVQPAMTSATTWSNEPSFGVTFSGGVFDALLPPWCMMRGPVDITPGEVPKDYEAWRGSNATTPLTTFLQFERPLRIEALAFQIPRYPQSFRFDITGLTTGSETLLFSGTNSGMLIEEHSITSRQYFNTIKITSTNISGGGYGSILANFKITAYYKP